MQKAEIMDIHASLEDLVKGLQAGTFTSVDLVKAFIARIEQVDGPYNSIVAINPNALSAATALDTERANGSVRGALHGVPILVKNNIATSDLPNTAGSKLLADSKTRDAFVVQKLRAAGAVILATTNLTEWANYRWRDSPRGSSGWSPYGGQTLAAYHPNQDPSGSSSGSGVAVDLFLGPAALGTETNGSIVSPAHRNNIVGIKPTVGLASRDMVVPITERQDTVGPMARSVRDAAMVLQAIAGRDANDKYTADAPQDIDYIAACKPGKLSGARIGVPWASIRSDKETTSVEIDAFAAAVEAMREAGAVIVEVEFQATSDEVGDLEQLIWWYDFPVNLAAYLAAAEAPLRSLAEIRDATQQHPEEDYPAHNTKAWDGSLSDPKYDNRDASFATVLAAYQEAGRRGLPHVLEAFDLDAVAMPTAAATTWSAVVGYPTITVPLNKFPADAQVKMDEWNELVDTGPGVPFGLSLLGGRFEEEKLLGLAVGVEQLYGRR